MIEHLPLSYKMQRDWRHTADGIVEMIDSNDYFRHIYFDIYYIFELFIAFDCLITHAPIELATANGTAATGAILDYRAP